MPFIELNFNIMQDKNYLAENLIELFNPSSYKEFSEGFFINKPKMRGYYYIFKNMRDPKFCLIVNTNPDFKYPTSKAKINDYVFIVFNSDSIENFVKTLPDQNFTLLMNTIDSEMNKRNDRNLPYGYYLDENGDLKVDLKKAMEVRRIFNLYLESKNIREVASVMKTNFSDIRDILHDAQEYMQMQDKIVSPSKLKEVAELMAQNVRGGTVAKRSIEDEIREVRQRRKQGNSVLQRNSALQNN